MRITWATRSFLDYRIPVYSELDRLCGNSLTVIYYKDVVPERCRLKLSENLGSRAFGLEGEIRLSGKKIQPLSTQVKTNPRIPFQPGLIKEIRKSLPDIMITDGFFQWTYASLWLRFTRKIPHVMCYEGTSHTERNSGLIRRIYRKAASRLIDHIVCNGVLCSDYVEELGYPQIRLSKGNMAADTRVLNQLTTNMLELEKLELKNELGLNQYLFIFIGRLVPLKGVDFLIKAWLKEFGGSSDVSLLIVGDGTEKVKLFEISQHQTLRNIRFTGNVDYDLIYKYYAIANLFIIPTLQDNWSLVVPEAMSCGLPIICSKYNGCWPELVKPENGWVFDPLDEEDFSRTLKTAWENRDKWEQMGQESLRIVKDYTPEKVAANIFAACLNVLNK